MTAAAVLCALSMAGSAASRTLEFEIEPIIMLKCVEKVTYALDATELLLSSSNGGPSLDTRGSAGSGALRVEAGLAATDLLDKTPGTGVDVLIRNACSLRGLGRGEGFLVEVKPVRDGRLIARDTRDSLSVRDARGKPGYARQFHRRFSIPQQRIRLDRPIQLDVKLTIDLRTANASGRYSSPIDGVFSVEVSAP